MNPCLLPGQGVHTAKPLAEHDLGDLTATAQHVQGTAHCCCQPAFLTDGSQLHSSQGSEDSSVALLAVWPLGGPANKPFCLAASRLCWAAWMRRQLHLRAVLLLGGITTIRNVSFPTYSTTQGGVTPHSTRHPRQTIPQVYQDKAGIPTRLIQHAFCKADLASREGLSCDSWIATRLLQLHSTQEPCP